MFEIPAGGRRYRALELLVKQKRLAKTAPIPCVIREGGIAEEDSLAENVQRAPLHPLDQFRAFLALREKGQSEEEIAAAFFVAVSVVKQRLRLASVSPKLLDVYAEDGITLDQLMAFTVNGDHERQEQVFERLRQSYSKEPHAIRRMLTEGAVRAADKRAQFVGVDAYTNAGGVDHARPVPGRRWRLAAGCRACSTGWSRNSSTIEPRRSAPKVGSGSRSRPTSPTATPMACGSFAGEQVPLTEEEQAARDALQAEMDRLEETYAEADEVPEEVDQRLGEIETALAAFDDRPVAFDPEEVGRAGAFVSIDGSGGLRVERGYVRPEDELPIEPEAEAEGEQGAPRAAAARAEHDQASRDRGARGDDRAGGRRGPEADPRPADDRTDGASDARASPCAGRASRRRLHGGAACPLPEGVLPLRSGHLPRARSEKRRLQRPGAGACRTARLANAFDARHQAWVAALPKEPADLWDALIAFDSDSRQALFAHCVSLSLNAVYEAYNRKPRALAHADRIAEVLDLDMVAAGWTPTVENYLGRVTKARILGAVREARGERAAQLIDHLKKTEMAEKAQELLAGSGWLPEPLRTPGRSLPDVVETTTIEPSASVDQPTGEETALNGGEIGHGRRRATGGR